MITRRGLVSLAALGALTSACKALGLKATVVSTTSVNGNTKTTVREAESWEEFEQVMGEVATDFSGFAKEVGATTAELGKALVDVPPQGEVTLSALAPSLGAFEGDVRYDYLKVARMNPNAEYDFKYVQIGMPEYDAFFKASAEMYGTAYQLIETGRHVHLAAHKLKGEEVPKEIKRGAKEIVQEEVDGLLPELGDGGEAKKLIDLWRGTAELGVKLAQTATETAQTGVALVASAPQQITNPKLAMHIKLIVKGLKQSVSLVKDTGKLLVGVVG